MPITKQALADAAALKINPERLDSLDAFLQQYFQERYRQAGVVRVQRYGVPIFEGTYGENTKPHGMQMDLIFHMASITKPVVAALIMILQEDGRLSVTDPVWRYLPEFTGGGRENICIWHLLTHTSGIDDTLWQDIDAYILRGYGLTAPKWGAKNAVWDAYNAALREKLGLGPEDGSRMRDPWYRSTLLPPLRNKPRSLMSYCGFGYELCRHIIFAVTGESLDEYAGHALLGPLGMTDTHWRVPREKWPRILGRAENAKAAARFNSEKSYVEENGNGALKSTTADMVRFMQMILNGGTLDGVRVLSRFSTDRMIQNYNADVPGGQGPDWNAWGLGFNVRRGKMDDSGILRSPGAFDHGGMGGAKILADRETSLALALFTAEYVKEPEEEKSILGRFFNLLYAAMEP